MKNHLASKTNPGLLDILATGNPLYQFGATDKPCGESVRTLTKNCCQTIHEERDIFDSFHLCSEAFMASVSYQVNRVFSYQVNRVFSYQVNKVFSYSHKEQRDKG